MANVVTDAELKLIEEAKAIRKAMAEQQALEAHKEAKKNKMKSNYNLIMGGLLVIGIIGLLFVEGKIG